MQISHLCISHGYIPSIFKNKSNTIARVYVFKAAQSLTFYHLIFEIMFLFFKNTVKN